MHKDLEIIEICCWKMDSDTHMACSLNTEILKSIYTYVQGVILNALTLQS